MNDLETEIQQLEQKRADLKTDINRVTHHIQEETLLEKDGGDKEWLVRALHSRRKMNEERAALKKEIHKKTQALLQSRAALKRNKQAAIDAVRERIFIDKARETLPKEIYYGIWRQVDEEQAR